MLLPHAAQGFAADVPAAVAQHRGGARQEIACELRMHQQRFQCVAGAGPRNLAIEQQGECEIEIEAS